MLSTTLTNTMDKNYGTFNIANQLQDAVHISYVPHIEKSSQPQNTRYKATTTILPNAQGVIVLARNPAIRIYSKNFKKHTALQIENDDSIIVSAQAEGKIGVMQTSKRQTKVQLMCEDSSSDSEGCIQS